MNEITRSIQHGHVSTQAAEGLPRLAWTLSEFEKLSELGFFGGNDRERERIELIEGELVLMHAKGGRHEWVRSEILNAIGRTLPTDLRLRAEPGWRPGGALYIEPDFMICPAGTSPTDIEGTAVILIIEVADSSLAYDLQRKAQLYAALGVSEYWVVNAQTLETSVHRAPSASGYASIDVVLPDIVLVAERAAAVSLHLDSLGIGT